MTRLAWRLARPNILSSVLLLAAVAVFAVLTRQAMTAFMHDSGLDACLAGNGDCGNLMQAFDMRFDTVTTVVKLLNVVPMLIGVFWGGPLIARELEQGTHRLVWTQSHGRGRWLAARLGVHLAGAAAVAAVFTQLMAWWFAPIERIQVEGTVLYGRLDPNVFDFRGIVPVAYAVFAFAVGAAAGALLRRTVPAMAVTLVLYLVTTVLVRVWREHFMAPLRSTYAFGVTDPRAGKGDWVLSHDTVDPTGALTTLAEVPAACRAQADHTATDACLGGLGYQWADTYQPIERFWTFQLIETGIFAGLAATALGFAAWWVVRKLA
ncbi:ABC transporter permease subunit [Dactylosporangium sp. NPDC005555]|uniref:ABC transporter permease subunit n=1 Tax=Dactylosporangium sp. NPDC005555 TaxID=3154889 RepID=UPI0033BCE476